MNPVFGGPQQSLQEILISSIIDFLESTTVKMYTSVNNGKANTEGDKNVTGGTRKMLTRFTTILLFCFHRTDFMSFWWAVDEFELITDFL